MQPQKPDFSDEIIQDHLPVHIEPPRDTFLPWHRVKKEFIRQQQWNDLTIRMIRRFWRRQLQQEEGDWSLDAGPGEDNFALPANVALDRPLRCLFIPGEDLLDIRALYRDINEFNCFLRYLGFNEVQGSDQRGTRVHVANNDVTSLPRVARDSRVLQDRFQSIASGNSQALRYVKEYGPFHVINLDLCGSLFPNTAKDATEYYDALVQLLAYQFENQKSEWLLFVTTMAQPAALHRDGLQKLCTPTLENFWKHKDFAALIRQFLPAGAIRDTTSLVDFSALDDIQIINLFSVAFGKWLLSLCHGAKPQWTIEMRKSFRYSLKMEQTTTMLSLAYALKPNIAPPIDASGMSTVRLAQKKFPAEKECAVKLAESVRNMADVDKKLEADPALRAELLDAQATLLEAAGYDRTAYVNWVEQGEAT